MTTPLSNPAFYNTIVTEHEQRVSSSLHRNELLNELRATRLREARAKRLRVAWSVLRTLGSVVGRAGPSERSLGQLAARPSMASLAADRYVASFR